MSWLTQEKARLDTIPGFMRFEDGKLHELFIDFTFPPGEVIDQWKKQRAQFKILEGGVLKLWDVKKDSGVYRELIDRGLKGQKAFKIRRDASGTMKKYTVVD